MKPSSLLTAAFLSLTAASQAAIIWSDTYSTDRTSDPNPYSYTGNSGDDYGVTTGGNTLTVDNGYLNIADTTTTITPFIQVTSNRFSTTTFNAGDTITVSMDIRVNSLTVGAGSASVPRFTIFTDDPNSGGESLTVGYTHANFTGETADSLGFYRAGGSAGSVGAGNGIGINEAGFNFGTYDGTTFTNNGTSTGAANDWIRISVTMTQGQTGYSGSLTNLTTSDSVTFAGNLTKNLTWANDNRGGIRVFAGQGGQSNFDIDNLTVDLTAIPEPSSVTLLGGLGALALLRRRRA